MFDRPQLAFSAVGGVFWPEPWGGGGGGPVTPGGAESCCCVVDCFSACLNCLLQTAMSVTAQKELTYA
jgi:hypothetical protein